MRRLFAKPIILLLLIAGLAGGYYYFIYQKKSPSPEVLGAVNLPKLPSTAEISQFNMEDLPSPQEVKDQIQEQTEGVRSQSLTLKEHIGVVLGTGDEKNDLSTIQKKTIEYSQYLYCKGVVDEWDATKN